MIAAAGKGALAVGVLAGADEINTDALGKAFVVYMGTHGDAGAHRADVVLPGAAYTEKPATYVNTEGRPQSAMRAAFPPGDAREDWAILRALSENLGAVLPWNSLNELRAAMYAIALSEMSQGEGKTSQDPFLSPISDFYQTNPIARASHVMAQCSALKTETRREAAE
jgi:NADH-quinone oxidoreductase subunit G